MIKKVYLALVIVFILAYITSFLIPQKTINEYEIPILIFFVAPYCTVLTWAMYKDEQEKERAKKNAE
jgi:hypothetical protein